jgi:DNA-directed RNA polymerase subunit RPC12/RpoP
LVIKAFCSTCQKDVQVDDGATAFCPVCSSPLLTVVKPKGPTDS